MRAPRCTSSQYAGGRPQTGLQRTLTRDTVGATCFKTSRRLAQISGPTSTVTPVTFPPGRARLEMKRDSIGLTARAMTIGIVFVARMTAAVDSLAPVTMTSGL